MNIKEAWIRECQLNKGGAQTGLKGNERETSVKCQMAFKNQSSPEYGPFDHRIRREGEEVMRGREAGSVGRREYKNIRACLSGCSELFMPNISALL